MSFALLWFEILLASILFVALFITLGLRRPSRLGRYTMNTLGLLPAFPLAYMLVIAGMMRFSAGLQGNLFWAMLALLVAYIAAAAIIRTYARRADAAGARRALSWPAGRIATTWLVLLSLLGMTIWNLTLQTQVEIQALRTQAGALALSVAPPVIPDSANAALVYEQATKCYNAALTEAAKKIDYRDLDPRSPEVAAYLQRQQKTLDLIRRAADMTQFRPDYDYVGASDADMMFMVNSNAPLRGHANLLVVAAKAQAAAGHPDLALDDCRRLYAMAAHMGAAPLLISGLVSVALDAIGSKTTAQILPTVTANEQLDRLPALDPALVSRRYTRCLRSEEAYGLARLCDFDSGPFPGSYHNPALGAGMWMLWLGDEVSYYRESMQRVRVLADQPYYKVLPQWKQLEAEGIPPPGQRRGIMTSILLPEFATTIRSVTDAQALRSCTTLALAATRYRLAHGDYPAKADALVPEFLDAIPPDPFDGKPMRFQKSDDGSVAIYSVGRDLTDNHGDVESKPKQNSRPADTGIILRPPAGR